MILLNKLPESEKDISQLINLLPVDKHFEALTFLYKIEISKSEKAKETFRNNLLELLNKDYKEQKEYTNHTDLINDLLKRKNITANKINPLYDFILKKVKKNDLNDINIILGIEKMKAISNDTEQDSIILSIIQDLIGNFINNIDNKIKLEIIEEYLNDNKMSFSSLIKNIKENKKKNLEKK